MSLSCYIYLQVLVFYHRSTEVYVYFLSYFVFLLKWNVFCDFFLFPFLLFVFCWGCFAIRVDILLIPDQVSSHLS
ncbi:hypothetical protein GYMLUDRAFT_674714 [Collybiopsis luxurians FD-317 M1]|uniref:Uncharacterized protein n=1 Tax=Collybiopsis luxurians FD-317 M1 TaxID=944289 RepID=A0A0D0B6Y8_9AGAR|nr:hypothetical protein GYMLUDRAFT_674714 [Collybiopsis luxurians FD-317 M1]